MDGVAKYHSLERTSPKGGPFIGTCWQCGKTNLPMAASIMKCENVARLTIDESLVIALQSPV